MAVWKKSPSRAISSSKNSGLSQKIAFTKDQGTETAVVSADQPTEATLYGDIEFSGTVAQPVISGLVELSGLLVNLPPEFPEESAPTESPINPIFNNLQIEALENSRINLGVGELILSGIGTVNGTAKEIQVNAPLNVSGGSFRLPSSRITLEDSGTVDVAVGGPRGGTSVDVNLRGTTRVTVRESSTRYESYKLDLVVQGDVVSEQGVNIRGTSDPPGLSNERIQAIVGQQEFLENLAAGVLGQGENNDLTQNIYSLALPSLTEGFTNALADSLQLDYLVLDYNPFDLGVIRAGKTLGFGVSLDGSRQLTRTNLEPIRWDLQLSYRIPSSNRYLSRTRFTIGSDESTAWRIGLDYSFRF